MREHINSLSFWRIHWRFGIVLILTHVLVAIGAFLIVLGIILSIYFYLKSKKFRIKSELPIPKSIKSQTRQSRKGWAHQLIDVPIEPESSNIDQIRADFVPISTEVTESIQQLQSDTLPRLRHMLQNILITNYTKLRRMQINLGRRDMTLAANIDAAGDMYRSQTTDLRIPNLCSEFMRGR